MRWFRHPHETHLSEYAEGSLSASERRRVADHLADCTRCRNRVRFIRELRAALRELPAPSPRSSLFEEIWERREAGERRILPVAPPTPPSRRSWIAAGVVVLVLLGAAAGYLLLAADEAVAGASELTARPLGGPTSPEAERGLRGGGAGRWGLSYAPAGWMADASRLRVRAMYRLAGDPSLDEAPRPRLADVVLEREGDRFEGEIALPSGTAYALLAVETLDGRRHDPGTGGEPWELRVSTPDGRPTYEALRQELEVEASLLDEGWRNVDQLAEVARRLTELYPFRPLGWFQRYVCEALRADSAGVDSLRAIHRVELRRLDAHMRAGAGYGPGDLAALLDYAKALGASEIAARARSRLERVAPDHPTLLKWRLDDLYAADAARPARLLDELDAGWRAGRISGSLALQMGVSLARQLGSGEDVLLWTDRAAPSLSPEQLDGWVLDLLPYPSIAPEARRRLRERIRRNADPPDDARLPLESRREFEAAAARRRTALLAALGESLLASDSTAAAIDALRRALESGWRPGAAEALARAYERAGDRFPADSVRALVAADPLRGADAGEGVERPAEPATASARAAAAELLERVAAAARTAVLPDSAAVSAAPGEAAGTPRDLHAVRLGIVALWQVPPSDGDLAMWDTMARWRGPLEEAGAEALVLLAPARAREGGRVRERTGWSPLVDDERRILTGVGGGWARQYAVLEDGHVSVHGDLANALRHVLLLARPSR